MKRKPRFIALMVSLIIIANFSIASSISVYAHESLLNVNYDTCTASTNDDGIDEVWYVLEKNDVSRHISHEAITIKYRFDDNPGPYLSWTPNMGSEADGEAIKSAYAESMKKWNNVCFYLYNPDGTITKKQLIQVIETTGDDYDLFITPNGELYGDVIASTGTYGGGTNIDDDTIYHSHYPQWIMEVNVNYFFTESYVLSAEKVNWARETVGAHELGHVLGLRDVDNLCGSSSEEYHHEEVLMGYGEEMDGRTLNITYKDIAGVAITRGFHTDNDHKWLRIEQSGGTYKYVCSICNGIPNDSNFTPSSYDIYGSCEEVHTLPSGNMMAVASYGNQDYYKCKYCRYVAPFSEIVTQNYNKICCSADYHRCVNTVNGLAYEFYEPHTLVDGVCTECTSHEYGNYIFLNKFSHQRLCACGATQTSPHYTSGSHVGEDFVPCGGCGYLLDMRDDIHQGIMSITQVSVNGSYIRSDGIVVLVDEDIEAYLAGTLQFYHPADLPVTQ